MAKATGTVARCGLKLLEFESDMVDIAGIKHRIDYALSHQKTEAEHTNSFEEKVGVVIISPKCFACVPCTKVTELESNMIHKDHCVPYAPNKSIMTSVMDSKKAEILTLSEITTAKYSD